MLGPRLNAAGRLDDMSLGIECLITDNEARALQIAQQLDELNRQRREIESTMQESALLKLEDLLKTRQPEIQSAYSICLFDHGWHQGVIGILASRIRTNTIARSSSLHPAMMVKSKLQAVDQRFSPARCAGSGCQAPP